VTRAVPVSVRPASAAAAGMSRRRLLSAAVAALAAGTGLRPAGLRAATRAGEPRLPLRTITAGVNVSDTGYRAVFDAADAFLGRARTLAEGEGFTLQTTRIATQPWPRYLQRTERIEAVLADLKAMSGERHMLAVGPAVAGEDVPVEVLVATAEFAARAGICSTIDVGSAARGVRGAGVAAAAQVIARLASPDPGANMYFAAVASLRAGTPYFPAGYHDAPEPSFAIGTQSPGLLMRICAEAGGIEAAEAPLAQAYGRALGAVERVGRLIQEETGWRYAGVDPTPATWGEDSIGTAIESLTGGPFGAPGTLAACRMLTGVVRAVPVQRTGYQGLFLPPLEDATLARRAHEHYGLASLLAFSAVCGTGLDTVALPGDVSAAELRLVIQDMAALAVRLDKPLTARLLPIPGRTAGELSGRLGDLESMRVLAVR